MGWNLPAGQMSQLTRPSILVYEPGKHSSAFFEPGAQLDPAGHEVQVARAIAPDWFENVPPGHRVSAELPCGQYVGALHSIGETVASPHHFPAGHGPAQ